MRNLTRVAVFVGLGTALWAQPGGPAPAVLYEGARVIIGDASPPLASGALLVQDGVIRAVGATGAVIAPAGTRRVDLTGKTVMPALVNVHVHMGYEQYVTWDVANHTPENVRDHLLREAFYGVAATTAVGTSPTEQMLQFRREQLAGKYPGTSRLIYMPGMAPPNGGPDEVLRVATNQNHAVHEVTNPAAARATVDRLAALGLTHLKMWVDDRRGTYPKFDDQTWRAILDEGHKKGMTVHAHAIALADQKAVVKAGVDVLVHMVQREPLDEDYLAIVREKKPYWATVIGLGDQTEVCRPDPFFEQALPDAVIARIRATMERKPLAPSCGPPAATAAERERQMAINFPLMLKAGARVVLATDTGIQPGHTFGSGEHVEMARWVQLGMTPAEAIVAATSRPAALMGQQDLGTLAAGKRASFLVLEANPLDDIRNTRRITDVVLDGTRVDRDALRASFKRGRP